VITVGLTGGIGSGKSTVATMLVARGAVLVDADVLAREVVEPGTVGLRRVVERFGRAVLLPDGSLDRPALARLVFDDPAALSDLNAVVHPLVGEKMLQQVASHAGTDDVVILDVPLLVEAGGADRYGVDGVLVVDAPEDIAVARLAAERAMSEEEALKRMSAQASRAERIERADFLIMNMGTLAELEEMVARAWAWIESLRAGASA
jgi:dephospho-CoA kinase